METDAFFWHLLKQLPETLFALLGLPAAQAAVYRFDSVEIKKAYRLDGLFVPTQANLPVYFVEVQFRRERRFYANLFAKVFSYLEANDPKKTREKRKFPSAALQNPVQFLTMRTWRRSSNCGPSCRHRSAGRSWTRQSCPRRLVPSCDCWNRLPRIGTAGLIPRRTANHGEARPVLRFVLAAGPDERTGTHATSHR